MGMCSFGQGTTFDLEVHTDGKILELRSDEQKQVSLVSIWRKNFSSSGNSKCKGPEARFILLFRGTKER